MKIEQNEYNVSTFICDRTINVDIKTKNFMNSEYIYYAWKINSNKYIMKVIYFDIGTLSIILFKKRMEI